MDSSIPANNNNTLMATGASLADLPLEEDSVSGNPGEEVKSVSPLEEEVDKILEEVRSSGRLLITLGII